LDGLFVVVVVVGLCQKTYFFNNFFSPLVQQLKFFLQEVQRLEEGMKAKRKQLLEEQAAACEGTVVRKTKAAMLMEKEAKLADPSERAVLINTQKKELQRFDREIEGIRSKFQVKIDNLLTASTSDLSTKSRKRDEALQSKKSIMERKIKIAYDDVDKEMLQTETAWLSRSSGVMFKGTKKLEAKEAEDQKKAEDLKNAKVRRKRP
tara:strand:- start:18 stop:635 length:618 start_codon:yes stop_codon:yes gene_type:complete